MKQILIATTNPGKIMTAKKILGRLGYEGLSFADLNLHPDEPDETQTTAEKIAAEKALGYAKQIKDLPVLTRDDTNVLIGVDEEDDPKNHNKAFVEKRAGKYTDENGAKVFAEVARKYGGEIPTQFNWGYALGWHKGDEIKVVSTIVSTDPARIKIVDQICDKKVPGFCFAPVMKVRINDEWKFDPELTDDEQWTAYWKFQADGIKSLLDQYEADIKG